MRGNRLSASANPPICSGRLREEIATLEQRLEQIGPDGDCGYERALVRFLEQQLGLRRDMLRAGE